MSFGITAQGLETIESNGKDKIILQKLDEIIKQYEISTIVVGMPISMKGTTTERTKQTLEFIHKLKCKYNKIDIQTVDERLTTVQAHRTMNELNIKQKNKKKIVDTISAVYILETYMNNQEK